MKNIDILNSNANDGDPSTPANLNGTPVPDGTKFADIFGAIFGHEIKHATANNKVVEFNGGDTEEKPIQISDQIIKEANEKK